MPIIGNAIQGACAVGFISNMGKSNTVHIEMGYTRLERVIGVANALGHIGVQLGCFAANVVTAADLAAILKRVAYGAAVAGKATLEAGAATAGAVVTGSVNKP
jgi:hypothetical protein